MAAGEIATHFSVTRPAISQHLAVLLAAGLVSERRVGTKRLFRARPEGLEDLQAFLTEMWPAALRRFKATAEVSASAEALTVGRPVRDPGR
jgi:DNA-binding transcriptional ArsR family regulator